MALKSERMQPCARKRLDTADIVREGIFQQVSARCLAVDRICTVAYNLVTDRRARGFALRGYDDDRCKGGRYMCRSCLSGNHSKFSSEICIHFPGLEGLEKPAVFVFPKIVVCLNCGHSEFSMPETELRSLVNGRLLAVEKTGPPSVA